MSGKKDATKTANSDEPTPTEKCAVLIGQRVRIVTAFAGDERFYDGRIIAVLEKYTGKDRQKLIAYGVSLGDCARPKTPDRTLRTLAYHGSALVHLPFTGMLDVFPNTQG